MASIWWFALKPRRKAKSAHEAGITNEKIEPPVD
jgi:cbb3-type cytochrome oxidase subunit 3